jgi:DNA polymerase-1
VIAAPEGRTLVMADYAQIELLVAAVASGDSTMLEAIRTGVDLHREVAAAMFGKAPGNVTDAERQVGKRLNFSGLYNVGAAKFARTLRASGVPTDEAEAADYLRRFSRAYPNLDVWRRALSVVEGHVKTLTGRVIPVTDADHWGTKTSYVVQGSACDGFKRALSLLFDTRDTVPGARLILALHDAVVIEVPDSAAEIAAGWVKQSMRDGMTSVLGDAVPVRVETKVAPVWLP